MKIKYIAFCSLILINSSAIARFHDHIDMTIDTVAPVIQAILPPPAKILSKPAIWVLKATIKWLQFSIEHPQAAQTIVISTKTVTGLVGLKVADKTATTIVEKLTPGEKEKEGKLTESEAAKVKTFVALMDKAAK